ncbi:hypothetical protein PGT21_012800 [Puccinia graminis f. sp. tritici]|uniref:Uncharacterized protein n=1 Tax=Puccinia graminis f. sp. tritici TaxID=56615 RepID=A0A5B0LXI5_PUCGR|nr:hypothetical protein PGT21_012800 [Puccinia graminis f. sp. tritici]
MESLSDPLGLTDPFSTDELLCSDRAVSPKPNTVLDPENATEAKSDAASMADTDFFH